jgi:hypothetical protein
LKEILDQGGRLTIKFPKMEVDTLPKGSSTPLLDKEALFQGLSLVLVENKE